MKENKSDDVSLAIVPGADKSAPLAPASGAGKSSCWLLDRTADRGGFRWLVVASAYAACLVNGHGYVGGLFINPVAADFGTDKSVAAFANSISFFFWSLGSVVAGRAIEYYGVRPVNVSAWVVTVLGPLVASFARDVTVYTVFWGGCTGL